jgi:molybdopterin-guanine dinucleotide biosynthesis protein B
MNVVGFAGYSGVGKTTLLEKLIPEMCMRGLRVSVIKHAHHGFDIDTPGKDSWRHREAGASEVLVSGGQRWALLHESRGEPEPSLQEHLRRLSACDWVIIEGFKREPVPKIELWRRELNRPHLYKDDSNIVAVASDEALPDCPLPVLPLNQPELIVDFILQKVGPCSA